MAKGKHLKIFTGNANRGLAEGIASYIGQELGAVSVGRHDDDEVRVQYEEDIRGSHVVLIQPTYMPETNLKELKVMAYTARQSSAGFVTAVIPYFGYGRSDWKDQPRIGIIARQVADELIEAGIQHILALDLHAEQIQGFFDPKRCIVDHLFGRPVFVSFFRHLGIVDVVNGAPNPGRAKVAQAYQRRLGGGMFLAVKDKPHGDVEVVTIVGDVAQKNVRIIDDEISTAGTVCLAAQALKEAGASTIDVVASHGKLVKNATARLAQAPIDRIFIGDSVAINEDKRTILEAKLQPITFAPLLGTAIKRLHSEESLSVLFDEEFVTEVYRGSYTA